LAITSVETREAATAIEAQDLARGLLPKKSWVRLDKIFTLSSESVVKNLAALTPKVHAQVLSGTCQRLGCK
jgi:mRNA interferase MazF